MRVSFVSSRGSIYLRDAMTAEWKEKELWLSPRRAHYAFPVLFIHPSVLCQPLTWKRKAIQRSNLEQKWPTSAVSGRAILMSKGPSWRSRLQEMWRSFLAHIFAKNISIHVNWDQDDCRYMLHVLSDTVQLRKCVVFEITGVAIRTQSWQGDSYGRISCRRAGTTLARWASISVAKNA